jgi:hypothetical protein
MHRNTQLLSKQTSGLMVVRMPGGAGSASKARNKADKNNNGGGGGSNNSDTSNLTMNNNSALAAIVNDRGPVVVVGDMGEVPSAESHPHLPQFQGMYVCMYV